MRVHIKQARTRTEQAWLRFYNDHRTLDPWSMDRALQIYVLTTGAYVWYAQSLNRFATEPGIVLHCMLCGAFAHIPPAPYVYWAF